MTIRHERNKAISRDFLRDGEQLIGKRIKSRQARRKRAKTKAKERGSHIRRDRSANNAALG